MKSTEPAYGRAERLFSKGNRYVAAGEADRGEACFREVIALFPDLPEAHTNLALLLEKKGRAEEAEAHYRRSIELDPDRGTGYLNLGAFLAARKRFAEAELAYQKALALLPDSPAVWSNLGVLKASLKKEEEGEQCYRKALEIDPDYRRAAFNLSYLLLRQGRYEEGWRFFEARDWHAWLERHIPCPRWQGEPLAGRSLLIGFEGGHGDMIMLSRFAAVLKGKGARLITLICHPALKSLFKDLAGVDAVYSFEEEIPSVEADFWTPPFSIPFYCKTRLDTIPDRLPYLHPDPALLDFWGRELAAQADPGALRVGLVWKGSAEFENDAERSLPGLDAIASWGTIPGIRFFSLQKGAAEEEASDPPAGLSLINLGPRIGDFADSAAIVANLDLVITVDTAVAHLAGALGKACWVLLPYYQTDWRWLKERPDSPWYPQVMRLYRQTEIGRWGRVAKEVRTALQRLANLPLQGGG